MECDGGRICWLMLRWVVVEWGLVLIVGEKCCGCIYLDVVGVDVAVIGGYHFICGYLVEYGCLVVCGWGS